MQVPVPYRYQVMSAHSIFKQGICSNKRLFPLSKTPGLPRSLHFLQAVASPGYAAKAQPPKAKARSASASSAQLRCWLRAQVGIRQRGRKARAQGISKAYRAATPSARKTSITPTSIWHNPVRVSERWKGVESGEVRQGSRSCTCWTRTAACSKCRHPGHFMHAGQDTGTCAAPS